jgi:hypothetical protein
MKRTHAADVALILWKFSGKAWQKGVGADTKAPREAGLL